MKEKEENIEKTPSSTPIMGQPETAIEMVNKYGTYEIQPTADTSSLYPTIAQGFNKKIINHKKNDLTGR